VASAVASVLTSEILRRLPICYCIPRITFADFTGRTDLFQFSSPRMRRPRPCCLTCLGMKIEQYVLVRTVKSNYVLVLAALRYNLNSKL
jgi:hypothetical protein